MWKGSSTPTSGSRTGSSIIEHDTGEVRATLDLSPLRERIAPSSGVANGIAYDAKAKRLYVTGKHWDKVFEIAVPEL